ncbi:MAG: hypothetical protein KDA24_01415 [Deltaproteobacteria bacterium]|nr:hypothetical protein [Deltaproteobacteria bacterium]
MSTPWRITRGNDQFQAKDVAELKLLAIGGKILAGDLVQPPGRSDWLYATEVPELDGLVKAPQVDSDEDWARKRTPNNALRIMAFVLGIGVVGTGFFGLYWVYDNRPDTSQSTLFGEHENALNPLEALATEHAALLKAPDSTSASIGDVKKDDRVMLVRKLGDFYEVTTAGGTTGWLGTGQVIPGYKFDQNLSDKYDPLFNPDNYLQLMNYSWTPSGEEDDPETLTNMLFELNNPTDYGMQGVMLRVSFKDGNDNDIDVKNIEVPRLIPPNDDLFIDGIEIDIEWDDETRAEVEIFGARALLEPEFKKLLKEERARLRAEAEAAGDEAK